MATHADTGAANEYTPGQMPVEAQAATFHGVMGMFKWGSLALAALLVLLVMWFCTAAGFIPAIVSALILTVLGVIFLREKPAAGH